MREREVERYLDRMVRARGGMTIKLAPTIAGLPDRLVVMPPNTMHLVELKAVDGRLSPIQRELHRRLAGMGVQVHVLYGVDGVRDWLGAESA